MAGLELICTEEILILSTGNSVILSGILGKYFIKIGKIRAKIHEIGKIEATLQLRMTPI